MISIQLLKHEGWVTLDSSLSPTQESSKSYFSTS